MNQTYQKVALSGYMLEWQGVQDLSEKNKRTSKLVAAVSCVYVG